MAAVMIGVDPHKGSHTAAIIGAAVEPLGELRVRFSAVQVQRLLAWAAAWPEWTWAVEGAGGLDHLLAQQLLAAGEQVLDVDPSSAPASQWIPPCRQYRPPRPAASEGVRAGRPAGKQRRDLIEVGLEPSWHAARRLSGRVSNSSRAAGESCACGRPGRGRAGGRRQRG
jgi:hypothetical protein